MLGCWWRACQWEHKGFPSPGARLSTSSPHRKSGRAVRAVSFLHHAWGGWVLLLFTLSPGKGASRGTLGKLDVWSLEFTKHKTPIEQRSEGNFFEWCCELGCMGSELQGVKMPASLAWSKEPACVWGCVCVCVCMRVHVCVLQRLPLKRTSGKDKKTVLQGVLVGWSDGEEPCSFPAGGGLKTC